MSPGVARVLGIAAALILSGYIVFDGWRQHGKDRLAITLVQAVGFLVVSMAVALIFLTPERLPSEVSIDLRTWGLMVVIGMVSCFFIQRYFGKKEGLTGDQILTLWVYGGLSALFGARLLHVSVNWGDYAHAPITALLFWDGGMAFVGGALAALVFTALYLRKNGFGLRALDALTLGVALTHGFGRIGCFAAGCCYGRETDSALAVAFPPGSIAQFTMAHAGIIGPFDSTPTLHPTQLYSSALTFLVGFVLLAWFRSGRSKPGTIVAGYFLLYPVVRFMIELIRGDPEREFPLVRYPLDDPRILSTTQTAALVLVPLAAAAMVYLLKRPEVRLPAAGAAPEEAPRGSPS